MEHPLKDIYIGRIIQAKVDEKGISYSEFARRINCARSSLYNIFNSKSIDVERLLLISEALNYNFIEEVYLKEYRASVSETACIQLPLINGKIDVSSMPKEILLILNRAIEEELL